MTSTAPPVVPEIAQRAQEFKILNLALQFGMAAFFLPDLPILRALLQFNGQSPDDDLPMHLLSDVPGDETRLTFSAREVMSKASQLRGEILGHDFMSIAMMTGATRIADMIQSGGYSRTDVPLLQFARHYRNACAHGDRWEFRPGEPKYQASCRHLTLTPALHGQRATFATVSPRLHVEFLDDITNYFLPGAVAPPTWA
jgi:hypothetical protein